MIPHLSEAIVLRTWPMQESDLLISLFTRDLGKVRGVAKAALRSRKRFGGTLEPMTQVRAAYAEKPRQELVRMDRFELIASPMAEPVDYLRATALALYAEVLENALPDHDPQDTIFRLTLAVLEQTRTGACWMPLTYFLLWTTRLIGWLPEVGRCTECGENLAGGPAYFHAVADGLWCALHKRPNSGLLHAESLAAAQQMLRQRLSDVSDNAWPRELCRDLRRFLVRTLERHMERRLNAAAVLANLGG